MTSRLSGRRLLATCAAVLVALTPLALDVQAQAQEPGPIHAGNTFGWYRNSLTRYEFIGPKGREWRAHGNGNVRTQHGMLTLNTARHGSTSATLARKGHRYGRWEIRLRSHRYGTRHANFRVLTELVPAGGRRQHCGGRNIGLESYRLGSNVAKTYVHTLPHNTFRAFKTRNLSNDRWHTFAVEVTPRHVSWFVDAHVVATERRAAAQSRVPLTVRFTMKAVPGKRMNPSRMQMDWLRYWGNQHPSTRSVKAPAMKLSRFADAC